MLSPALRYVSTCVPPDTAACCCGSLRRPDAQAVAVAAVCAGVEGVVAVGRALALCRLAAAAVAELVSGKAVAMFTAGLDAAAVGVAGHLAGGQYHGSFATCGSHCVQAFAAGQQEFPRDPLPVRPRKQRLRVRVLRHGHVDTAHRIDGVNGQHTGQQRRHHALDDVRQRLPAYGQPIRDLHGLGEFRHWQSR